MNRQQLFPTILIILDILAALNYCYPNIDLRKVVYWVAAAVLTFTITY